jgi:flavorubredoxin
MHPSYSPLDDVHVLPSYVRVPGFGVLTANAFVIQASEPVLVDTGLAADRGAFLPALEALLDPADLAWVFLTHVDPDHVGNLRDVLEAAPRARVVTNFIAVAKLNLSMAIPPERFYLLNAGQTLDVGDHRLTAMRPPIFDAPETMAFFDPGDRVLFSADCFGALLDAPVEDARAVPASILAEQQSLWATIDAPWLEGIDPRYLRSGLDEVRSLRPNVVLSSHLPMARGMIDVFVETLVQTAGAAPFVGPDQAALHATMPAPAEAAPMT